MGDHAGAWRSSRCSKTAKARSARRASASFAGRCRRSGSTWAGRSSRASTIPKELTPAEFASFYATVINRIAYASLEAPRIDADGTATFDILWCPHQDHYGAFDCRVQRYFVQGMIDAAREKAGEFGFDVRFDTTIPSGAPTCHFTMWKPTEEERAVWGETTKLIEAKALAKAKKPRVSEEGA